MSLINIALDQILESGIVPKKLLEYGFDSNIHNRIGYYLSFQIMLKSHNFISRFIDRIYRMPFNRCDKSLFIIMDREFYGWNSYYSYKNKICELIRRKFAIYDGIAELRYST